MIRGTVRSLCVLGTAAVLAGCGPDPEPTTAATPPAPTVTATVAAPTPTTPPPAEPTVEARRAAAKAAFDAKDWGKAKVELGAILGKNPADVEANKMLGQVYEAENNATGATDAYFAASKADGGKDEALAMTAGRGLYDQKRYDDLVTLMQLATKANDKSMPLWMYLGMGQSAKEDHAAAVETYTKLTTSFPDEPQLWAQLALAQAGAGKADDAKKSAKAALDKWIEVRKPKSTKEVKLGHAAEEIAMIARAFRRAGDNKAALAALDKYPVPKDEVAPLLDVERGFTKLVSKDVGGAKQAADKAQKTGGDEFAPARLLQAGVAAQSKKADEAKAHLAAFEKSNNMGNAFAVEKKWVEGAIATAGEAPKPTTGGGGKKPGPGPKPPG